MLILGLCLNVGIGVVSEGLGISFTGSGGNTADYTNAMNSAISNQNDLTQSVNGDAGFLNTNLIFGDFIKGATILANALTFQYLINILQVFGFNGTFLLGIRAIGAIIAVFSILYMITGRGSRANI